MRLWPRESTPGWLLLTVMGVLAILVRPGAAAEAPAPFRSLLEMRQENVVVQHWDLSCGAATLATILTYEFGDPVSEKTVAEGMLGRTEPSKVHQRGGFSLLDMKRYAQNRGYQATGYAGLTLKQLVERAPAIVPLHALSANHFVVFRGLVGHDRVAIADPAWGNRTLPLDEFEAAWGRGIGFVIARPDGWHLSQLGLRPDDRLLPSEK